MKIRILSSYLFEVVLAIVILMGVLLFKIDLQRTVFIVSQKLGILFTIYGALIALCGGLIHIMINEPETEFIKWLISKKAEATYRHAAWYILFSFIVGMIFIGINNICANSYPLSIATGFFIILNSIQILTMFLLINNYVSLKRKWQELS